jgi:hypothetical protein
MVQVEEPNNITALWPFTEGLIYFNIYFYRKRRILKRYEVL